MSVVEKRLVEVTARYLKDLNQSKPVMDWVLENMADFGEHMSGYNELIDILNSVPADSPLLQIMPKTRLLKKVLAGENLPTLEQMMPGNYVKGLYDAHDPMVVGQKIKTQEIASPTETERKYQIGTPSMNTSLEALAVGTAGHLAERTFFAWARSKGHEPEQGWEKDDWLQALDEAVELSVVQGNPPHLFPLFAKLNSEGGLGWVKKEKMEDFSRSYDSLTK